MEKNELKEVIDQLIECTFKSIESLFKSKDGFAQCTRLCFPTYHHGASEDTLRLSEQELRFLFVEEFNKNKGVKKLNLRYSVETPTIGWYNNTGNNKRSGNFDLTIWQNGKLVSIIEFKARNRAIDTDLRKLTNPIEGDVLRYFVSILEKSNRKTVRNIKKKKINPGSENDKHVVFLRFHSMEKLEPHEEFPLYHKY